MKPMEPTEDCCKVWPKLWWAFYWMTTEDRLHLVMPYMQAPNSGHAQKWRVNHCPSCGADVRNCVVDRERFADKLF